jgi:hypothetical protein
MMGKSAWMLFLEKSRKKMGGPKTLAVLAMLAVLLFDLAQRQYYQGVGKTALPEK